MRTKMLMATCKSAVLAQAFEKFGIKFDKQVALDDALLTSDMCNIYLGTVTLISIVAAGRWKCANFRKSRVTLKLRRRHRMQARL